jgi:SAM-dependent methyltransferase
MSIVRKSARVVRRLLTPFKTAADLRAAREKLLHGNAVTEREKALLRKVSLRIHRDDGMYDPYDPSDARHYLSVGLSAIRCIDRALGKAGGDGAVRSVLDFPCGHGRVLRFLGARFPDASITAAEIDTEALAFCRREFSVNAVESNVDFNKMSLPGKFDLIWCGSLVTHTDEKLTSDLLKFFHDHLAPGGTCVFSMHGQFVIESIQNGTQTYGLRPPAIQALNSQFHDTGYGYADYADQRGYGISVATHQRMEEIARGAGRWSETSFVKRGWDDHHDVYGFTLLA